MRKQIVIWRGRVRKGQEEPLEVIELDDTLIYNLKNEV